VQVAAGRIGQPPAPDGTPYELTVNTRGRLTEAEEFADLIVKSGSDGQTVRVRDVARVELAAQNLRYASKFRGQPSASLAIYQLPGANALDVAAEVRRTMERLATGLPEGVSYRIPFESTAFVSSTVPPSSTPRSRRSTSRCSRRWPSSYW